MAMMKWWTTRRQVYLVAASLAVVAYVMFTRRSLPRPMMVGAVGTEVCSFSYDQLPSMVWSHRAHFDDTSVDGSIYSVANLLRNGIRNFDVDVSCRRQYDADPCEFIVAHPTVAASGNTDVQSVKAFLLQIYHYCKDHDGLVVNEKVKLRPAVTLEMKFTGMAEQLAFVQLVQQSPLADHVAIIGADPLTLAGIIPHIRRGGIAAAYRTLPLTDHDYNWPAASYSGSIPGTSTDTSTISAGVSQPHPMELQPLVKYAHVEAAAAPDPHGAAVVEADTQTLVLAATAGTAQGAAHRAHGLLQVYMPDFKLIKQRIASFSAPEADSGGGTRLLVPWVVDDAAVMWDLLARKGVDAVISNRPVQMLQALQSAHRRMC